MFVDLLDWTREHPLLTIGMLYSIPLLYYWRSLLAAWRQWRAEDQADRRAEKISRQMD